MVTLDTRPTRIDKLDQKDLGDEILFYDAAGDEVHVLNGTAREIYLLCDGNRTVRDLIGTLLDRYEVDEISASRDVRDFLGKLVDLGLIGVS